MPGDPEFHPTSYPEVNTVLALLLSEVRAVVGEELLGMYLNGSLSLGAFEPGSSDIDFLVATVDALTDEQVRALRDMHARLLTSGLSYATRLEGFYLPQAALRRSDPATTRYPFSAQAEGLLMVELGSDWVIQRHLVRFLDVLKFHSSFKGKVDLGLVENVEQNHVVPAVPQLLQGFDRRLGVGQKV